MPSSLQYGCQTDKLTPTPPRPYQPLEDDRHIRLCEIVSEASEPFRLSLTLRKVDPVSAPPCCALSYTWGAADADDDRTEMSTSEDDLIPVKIDQGGVRATRNLLAFLCQCVQSGEFLIDAQVSPSDFAQNSMVFDIKYLWIDAICIDQDNLVERSQQVSAMGQVYDSVTLVIVWLGRVIPDLTVRWVLDGFVPVFMELIW